MIAFEVNDMTCGHCTDRILRALKAVDPQATIEIDLVRHRVEIEPAAADARQFSDAIGEAGYTPLAASSPARVSRARTGCCCA